MGRNLERLAGAAGLVAACSSGGGASPLALYPASAEAHEALLRGTLSLEGDCLYIVGDGGERWLAAFPSPGTTWEPGENAVQVGARTLRVGAPGAFAGGEAPNPPGALKWVQPPAPGCESAKLWMVSTLADP